MDATPRNHGIHGPDDHGDGRTGGADHGALVAERPQFAPGSASAVRLRWSALHDAAAAVGAIAGLAPEPMPPEVRDFPALIRDAGGWRRERAEQGIDDLAAIMEPGLAALLAAHGRGTAPAAAAQALWREFQAARDALLALAPPPER